MRKKKQLPTVSEHEIFAAHSEDSIDSIKYVKKLKIQHSVLNKLLDTKLNPSEAIHEMDQENPDANKSLTNK